MKTFLSIGSGPGIGFATAARFALEGYRITLSNRHPDNAQALADRLKAQGYHAEARAVDCSDAASVAALIAGLERQRGTIDVLHYNVASMRKATLLEQPQETFGDDLAANIGGALVAVQAVARQMSVQQSGTILLTGGHFAITPSPEYLSLSIGKAAIRALTLGMFETFKQQGIHIASVNVGINVVPDSPQAEAVGELFWQLHDQPFDKWTVEVNYSGQ